MENPGSGRSQQGLDCDFDRLRNLANRHTDVRAMLGHADVFDRTGYHRRTVIDNVSLLTPDLLRSVSDIVVECAHEALGRGKGDALHGRVDSFVVETDVHYPTDVSLL